MLLRRLIRELGLDLHNKSIFDYGFGAGSFFLACPRSASLHGVELDPANVSETALHLRQRGFRKVHLTPLDPRRWREHPLLHELYDLVVCSHVLEHVDEPVALLAALSACLQPRGVLLVLLPLNERRVDTHHLHVVTRLLAHQWVDQAALDVRLEIESDYVGYLVQPLFYGTGLLRITAQGTSLLAGLAAQVIGSDRWMPLWDRIGPSLGAKPAQLASALTLPGSSR